MLLPLRGSPHWVIQQVLHDEPPAPRALNDILPRDLETVCLKAMAKEPRRRYAGARELADDLRRYLRDEPVVVRPLGRSQRLWCLAQRRPLSSGMAAALTLAVLGGCATTVVLWRRTEAAAALASVRAADAERNYRTARAAVDGLYCT